MLSGSLILSIMNSISEKSLICNVYWCYCDGFTLLFFKWILLYVRCIGGVRSVL